MMKKAILSCMLTATLLFAGCYEDKGHYDYIVPNEVTITMTPPTTSAYLGEEYVYTPGVTFRDPEHAGDHFKYWWEIISNEGKKNEVVTEGKELRYIPGQTGSIRLLFCVMDTRNDYITTRELQLTGMAQLSKGWLILSDENGRSVLSYIRPGWVTDPGQGKIREYTAYPNLYASMFPQDPLGTGARSIRQTLNANGSLVYILQDEEAVCLNGDTYQKEVYMKDEFLGTIPAGWDPVDFEEGGEGGIALTRNGHVYYRSAGDFFIHKFYNFPLQENGEILKIDRLLHTNANFVRYIGMQESSKNRFLWLLVGYEAGPFGSGKVVPTRMGFPENSTEFDDQLNLNRTEGTEMLYCGSKYSYNSNPENVFLYRRHNDVFFQVTTVSSINAMQLEATITLNKKFPHPEILTENTCYFQLPRRPYLFLADKNQVYFYEMTNNNLTPFYTLPAGEKVVGMSCNPGIYTTESVLNSELGVLLESGRFLLFDITHGMLSQGKIIYQTELPGKGVAVEYKYMNAADRNSSFD